MPGPAPGVHARNTHDEMHTGFDSFNEQFGRNLANHPKLLAEITCHCHEPQRFVNVMLTNVLIASSLPSNVIHWMAVMMLSIQTHTAKEE